MYVIQRVLIKIQHYFPLAFISTVGKDIDLITIVDRIRTRNNIHNIFYDSSHLFSFTKLSSPIRYFLDRFSLGIPAQRKNQLQNNNEKQWNRGNEGKINSEEKTWNFNGANVVSQPKFNEISFFLHEDQKTEPTSPSIKRI